MSSIKELVKYTLGFYRCKINHIKTNHHVYIGKSVNIVGGVLIQLDQSVSICPYVDLWSTGGSIKIGTGSVIGERSRISIANELEIGKHVLFSPNVYVTDCDHEYRNVNIPVIQQGIVNNENKVSIGDGAYIGINSVIVGNVKIGKGSVVGANSVVTKDVPDFCVVAGSPARIIKKYNPTSSQWEQIKG